MKLREITPGSKVYVLLCNRDGRHSVSEDEVIENFGNGLICADNGAFESERLEVRDEEPIAWKVKWLPASVTDMYLFKDWASADCWFHRQEIIAWLEAYAAPLYRRCSTRQLEEIMGVLSPIMDMKRRETADSLRKIESAD